MSADSERSTATPSTDPVNLEANQWLPASALERLSATVNPVSTAGTSRIAKSAAHVQLLAQRLGRSAEDVASTIDPDTLRRLKYPVITIVNDDGTRRYERDIIDRKSDGLIPNLGKDGGTTGRTAAPKARASDGKFSK